MVPRYTALPIIAIILKILSYVVLLVTLLSSAFLLVVGSMPQVSQTISTTPGILGSSFLHAHLIPAFTSFLSGSLLTLFIMAFSHGIHVLLDIEENTRRTADLAAGEPSQPTPTRTER